MGNQWGASPSDNHFKDGELGIIDQFPSSRGCFPEVLVGYVFTITKVCLLSMVNICRFLGLQKPNSVALSIFDPLAVVVLPRSISLEKGPFQAYLG